MSLQESCIRYILKNDIKTDDEYINSLIRKHINKNYLIIENLLLITMMNNTKYST